MKDLNLFYSISKLALSNVKPLPCRIYSNVTHGLSGGLIFPRVCHLVAKFKDICPGGMGYTVLPKPPVNKPLITYQEPVVTPRPRPLPTPEKPVEAFGEPDKPIPGEAEPWSSRAPTRDVQLVL